MQRRPTLEATLLLACACAQTVQAQSDFESYTEEPSDGWSAVSERLATRLVTAAGAKDLVDQCMADAAPASGYRQFLVAKPIALSTGKQRFRFVRPATTPHCDAFYGAHIYTFWLVDQRQEIVFSRSADAFTLLESSHNGLRDLVVSQCRAGYCFRTTFAFDKRTYQEASCETTAIETKTRVPGCIP